MTHQPQPALKALAVSFRSESLPSRAPERRAAPTGRSLSIFGQKSPFVTKTP